MLVHCLVAISLDGVRIYDLKTSFQRLLNSRGGQVCVSWLKTWMRISLFCICVRIRWSHACVNGHISVLFTGDPGHVFAARRNTSHTPLYFWAFSACLFHTHAHIHIKSLHLPPQYKKKSFCVKPFWFPVFGSSGSPPSQSLERPSVLLCTLKRSGVNCVWAHLIRDNRTMQLSFDRQRQWTLLIKYLTILCYPHTLFGKYG